MKQTILTSLASVLMLSACATGSQTESPEPPAVLTFNNPIIKTSLPDPTVVRAPDGHFYLYATEDVHNVPIYRSDDLVNWTYQGTAFTDETRPKMVPGGGIWAPDINRADGQYLLYYSKSEWGGEWDCGIGVATAAAPTGPFTDRGKLFISKEIGIQNCIDPFYIEDGGHKYLFWGSFHGIYGVELTPSGLALYPGAKPVQIAGNQMEATYIHKRDGYYYLFGSAGACCNGANSDYRIICGRSSNLFGPYLTRSGKRMLDGESDLLLQGNDRVAGPGHNAEFVTDDAGQDWIIYHGYRRDDPDMGRLVWMDRVDWQDGWPVMAGSSPSGQSAKPVFK
ncbi:family 43 glycosylhydrolase [Prevotella sp. kh1p2]|uniref:family 43 glycosylhydrolase n=1 Tax=Prevotella sp. kh1p2 TaxID=1761883 RepID=UPI0008ACBFEA|nr:family 43 glycosylhydrolase [Prevotella sp. kh1p2]SES89453.1 arabinan endo-1,5-alpha-L-arabinosidase [Prevotella sp. kh1p2]SNU11640.1 arabinan endo-1,5-alpha-L-arabinosidase [Prevotellaceae bacterium KH2P17]